MLEYRISARRVDAHGSVARCKDASLLLDTDVKGREDALNPAELLLAALAACMIRNIERVAPILGFRFRGVGVEVHGVRQDSPPRMAGIDYVLTVDTDEDDRRLDLLHTNVQRYGTVYGTLAAGTVISGAIRRGSVEPPSPAASETAAAERDDPLREKRL